MTCECNSSDPKIPVSSETESYLLTQWRNRLQKVSCEYFHASYQNIAYFSLEAHISVKCDITGFTFLTDLIFQYFFQVFL